MFIPCNYVNGDWILHVYCDQNIASHLHRWMGEFIDQYSVDRINAAKKAGWELHTKTKTARCPICVKRLKGL